MRDLIDRQAVLKHIEKVRQSVQMMDDIRRASIIMNGMYLCEEAVRNQRSAQPEIIRCKDCKHYKITDNRAFGFPVKVCKWTGFEDVDDDDFCSRAERRTDGSD